MPVNEMRICRSCGEEKPLNTGTFESINGGKFRQVCRCCRRAACRAWHAANREKVLVKKHAHYQANREASAESGRRWRQANKEAILERNRVWKAANREKVRGYEEKHRSANRQKLAEYQQAHYAANKDKIKERHRAWRVANKDSITARAISYRKENRESVLEGLKSHYRRNREKYRVWKSLRRAAESSAIPPWFGEIDRFALREAYRLARLRAKATGFQWHVDHIIPLRGKSVRGLHVHNNLAVIPAVVNREKGNRMSFRFDPSGRHI